MKILFLILLLTFEANAFDLLGSIGNLSNSVGSWANDVGSSISGAFDDVTSELSNVSSVVGQKLNEFGNSTSAVASNLGQDIQSAFSSNGAVTNFTQNLSGNMYNLSQTIDSAFETKLAQFESLASRVKAFLTQGFQNQSVAEEIGQYLNNVHADVNNGSSPYFNISGITLQNFQNDVNALKNANNLTSYCATVRDNVVSIIQSEDQILAPYAYKQIIDLSMDDLNLTNDQRIECYTEYATIVNNASQQ